MQSSRLRRLAGLAVITALLGVGIWWLTRSLFATSVAQAAKTGDILAPVENHAFITQSDGQQALNNPRGSTVKDVTLSDGTRVWLNAGSSIRYPAVFPSYDRTVEIRGEAYFEVASDASRPFGVKMGNAFVRVLGTSFNIKTNDPRPRITVLEGEVRVSLDKTLTLEAGQQAVVQDKVELVRDINIDGVSDWKKGLFSFSHTDLVSAMSELSRWYDVDVVYEKIPPNRYFTGKLDRTLTLDQVLKTLSESRLNYSIDPGKRQLKIRP